MYQSVTLGTSMKTPTHYSPIPHWETGRSCWTVSALLWGRGEALWWCPSLFVLVSSGCRKKIPQTGWLKNRHLFLTVEAGSPMSRCQLIQFLLRVPSWLADGHLLAASSHDLSSVPVWGEGSAVSSPSCKGTNFNWLRLFSLYRIQSLNASL